MFIYTLVETIPPESYDHGRDPCYESKLFALSFELSPQRIAQAKLFSLRAPAEAC